MVIVSVLDGLVPDFLDRACCRGIRMAVEILTVDTISNIEG